MDDCDPVAIRCDKGVPDGYNWCVVRDILVVSEQATKTTRHVGRQSKATFGTKGRLTYQS